MGRINQKGLENYLGRRGKSGKHQGTLSRDEDGFFLADGSNKYYLKDERTIGFEGGYQGPGRWFFHRIKLKPETSEKPYMVVRARYIDTAKARGADITVINTNIAENMVQFHQMYDHLAAVARQISASEKKGLELKLTLDR